MDNCQASGLGSKEALGVICQNEEIWFPHPACGSSRPLPDPTSHSLTEPQGNSATVANSSPLVAGDLGLYILSPKINK